MNYQSNKFNRQSDYKSAKRPNKGQYHRHHQQPTNLTEAERQAQEEMARCWQKFLSERLKEVLKLVDGKLNDFRAMDLYQMQFLLNKHFNVIEQLPVLDQQGKPVQELATKSRLGIWKHRDFQRALRDRLAHEGFTGRIELQELDADDLAFQKTKDDINQQMHRDYLARQAGKRVPRRKFQDPVRPDPRRKRGPIEGVMLRINRPHEYRRDELTLWDCLSPEDRAKLGIMSLATQAAQ